MAVSAAPLETGGTGTQSRRGALASELWVLTGSTGVATDSVAITPRFIKKPLAAIGPVGYSVSGQAITVTLLSDLGNQTTLIEIIGRVG